MQRRPSAVIAVAVSLSAAAAFASDWPPGAADMRRLVSDLREAGEAGPAPAAAAVPERYEGGCHTLVDTEDLLATAGADGTGASVSGRELAFARSLELRLTAGDERTPILMTDRHGGEWLEAAGTAELVRAGGRRPSPRVLLVPRHAGYLLDWPGETPKGCGGGAPRVTLLQGQYSLEAARKLVAIEAFARKNRGVQPTAKPRGGDWPPKENPKG